MNGDDLRDHFQPEHWADLINSDLTPKTIEEHGIYSARPSDIPKLIGWDPKDLSSALVFPYPGQSGFCRIKCFPPLPNKNGHTIRYLQKKGSGVRLYIPNVAASVLKDPSISLNWTEGEKKALRANQEGISCIALGGLWNWIEDNGAIEGLDEIAHVNRVERFYPDGDVWVRPDLLYDFAMTLVH
jgi:putative DNA primase/helicase